MRYLDIVRSIPAGLNYPDETDLTLSGGQARNASNRLYEINELNETIADELVHGENVKWDSPLYGRRSGWVAMAPESGWLVVGIHCSTGELAFIKTSWLVT